MPAPKKVEQTDAIFDRLKQILKTALIFDGRNLYDPGMVSRFGFTYYAIGRGKAVTPS